MAIRILAVNKGSGNPYLWTHKETSEQIITNHTVGHGYLSFSGPVLLATRDTEPGSPICGLQITPNNYAHSPATADPGVFSLNFVTDLGTSYVIDVTNASTAPVIYFTMSVPSRAAFQHGEAYCAFRVRLCLDDLYVPSLRNVRVFAPASPSGSGGTTMLIGQLLNNGIFSNAWPTIDDDLTSSESSDVTRTTKLVPFRTNIAVVPRAPYFSVLCTCSFAIYPPWPSSGSMTSTVTFGV